MLRACLFPHARVLQERAARQLLDVEPDNFGMQDNLEFYVWAKAEQLQAATAQANTTGATPSNIVKTLMVAKESAATFHNGLDNFLEHDSNTTKSFKKLCNVGSTTQLVDGPLNLACT